MKDCVTYTVKVFKDGKQQWYVGAKLHRDGAPAVLMPDGSELYYHNNLLHRENGPAVRKPNGKREFWLNGKQYTQQQWLKLVTHKKEN